MGILEKLKNLSGDKKEFKEKLKQAQEEDKINNLIEERKKSSNQREAERLIKGDEEDRIKKFLNKRRNKESKELWSGKGNAIIKSQKSIMKNDRPILKEKHIFMGRKNNISFLHGGGMFLK